jgi:uncharacterized protein (TIGR03437 family)
MLGAAGFVTSLSNGELASIFGTNLTPASVLSAAASSLPLPVVLGGVQVFVNGMAAPLLYVSPTQINLQVPFETPIGSAVQVVVTVNGVPSLPLVANFSSYAPGVFTYQRAPGAMDPVIVHADNTLVTPTSPAQASEILTIYATGAGALNNAPADGAAAPSSPPATTTATPVVTVGGSRSAVQFCGLTPGLVGLLQINTQLPVVLPAGTGTPLSLPLVVTFPGASSAPTNLWVK